MPSKVTSALLLRWMFSGTGYFLLFFHSFAVRSVLQVPFWANFLAPGNYFVLALLMGSTYIALIPVGLLCLATASGLKRGYRWARWTGIAASLMLLCGFPWLTILGGIGLYALRSAPQKTEANPQTPQKRTKDRWYFQGGSKLQQFFGTIVFFASMSAFSFFSTYAAKHGMGPDGIRVWWWWLVYLQIFSWINTAVHEIGHAVVAWSLHFEFRVISIGPLMIWRDPYGYQWRINWLNLMETNGHVGSVPVSEGMRWKQMAVVAAGPLASLGFGVVSVVIFLAVPGSAWERYWWIPAFNATVALCYTAGSLLPLGYSDGSMLFHMGLGTSAGKLLMDRMRLSKLMADCDAYRRRGEYHKIAELQERILEMAKKGGESSAMATAHAHSTLGYALLEIEDWPGAAREFAACLKFDSECGLEPMLASNSKALLHKTHVERFKVAEAGPAYLDAAEALHARKRERKTGVAILHAMVAELHTRAGEFQAALPAVAAALQTVPKTNEALSFRASMHRVEAECHMAQGNTEAGRTAIAAALSIARQKTGDPSWNEIWEGVGVLATRLWRFGFSAEALELCEESTAALERGGATDLCAMFRIKQSAMLRQLGRLEDAELRLPPARPMHRVLLRQFLEERARLHMAFGRSRKAVEDCRVLAEIWSKEPDCQLEQAAAESLLAEALRHDGNTDEAGRLAKHAAEVLSPVQHPEAASAVITMQLALQEMDRSAIDQALDIVQSHCLLTAAERARRVEAQHRRMESHSHFVEATALQACAP